MRTEQEINERIAYLQGYLRALEDVLGQYIDDTKTRVALEEKIGHHKNLIDELQWVAETPCTLQNDSNADLTELLKDLRETLKYYAESQPPQHIIQEQDELGYKSYYKYDSDTAKEALKKIDEYMENNK